jgi:hypothetical protein
MEKSGNDNKVKPVSYSELKEGIHFYYENGLMVFTETYHLLRGYCCNSGCRHCPYSKEKDKLKSKL